jgi:hypothetical protein
VILSVALTVPYKTPVSSPVRLELSCGKGTLTQVSFDVPPGANGELYLRVLHLENSIVPDTIDEWVPVNGNLYRFQPNFSDWQGVYRVILEGCSPDARYAHTVEVALEIDEVGTVAQILQGLLKMGSYG